MFIHWIHNFYSLVSSFLFTGFIIFCHWFHNLYSLVSSFLVTGFLIFTTVPPLFPTFHPLSTELHCFSRPLVIFHGRFIIFHDCVGGLKISTSNRTFVSRTKCSFVSVGSLSPKNKATQKCKGKNSPPVCSHD